MVFASPPSPLPESSSHFVSRSALLAYLYHLIIELEAEVQDFHWTFQHKLVLSFVHVSISGLYFARMPAKAMFTWAL